MAASTTALSENFYNEFHDQCQAISDAVGADAEAHKLRKSSVSIEKHQAGLSELQRKVQDAAVFTNSHDQRIYAAGIKNLQDKIEGLRDLTRPRSKFSFKSSRKTADARLKSLNDGEPTLVSGASNEKKAGIKINIDNLLDSGDELIKHKNFSLTGEQALSDSTTSVQNVSASVVDLTRQGSGQLAGLHIINIRSSIVFCGSVSGGLHITNVHDSVLVAQTHQFRMHQCSNVAVYLIAGSSPIIENCDHIRFAPLEPSSIESDTELHNKWDKVSDFQYPSIVGPSPNWSIISEADRVDVGKSTKSGGMLHGQPVGEIARLSELRELLTRFLAPGFVTEGDRGEDHVLEKISK